MDKRCESCPLRVSCVEICPEVEASLPKEHDGRDRFMRDEINEVNYHDFLFEQQRIDALRALRGHLKASQLVVFEAYYLEAKGLAQIAEEQGLSREAAAQRLSSARKRLLRIAEKRISQQK